MHMDTDERPPSKVTDDYWVYADAPGTDAMDISRCGKWLVFVLPGQIDTRWAQIKEATDQGRLGITAKAATARQNPLATSPAKLICAYTRDWQDSDDVRRVLRGLRELGVSGRLSYKTDEATEAGVYGRGSSLYVSQPGSADFEDRTRPRRQEPLF
jgi:Domain of unknown function (DUF1917)